MSSRQELEKLTATKLRELAQEYDQIVGASAMKKGDLVVAILQARGEPLEECAKDVATIAQAKQQIRSLKQARAQAAGTGEAIKLRRQIKRLKRRTRILARAAK